MCISFANENTPTKGASSQWKDLGTLCQPQQVIHPQARPRTLSLPNHLPFESTIEPRPPV